MNQQLKSYIDHNIIQEYAFKGRDGYSLFVSDIDEHEQENLIDFLFKHDPAIKDMVLDRAQELINQRLPSVESQDNYNKGLCPTYDRQTGEVQWIRNRGAV